MDESEQKLAQPVVSTDTLKGYRTKAGLSDSNMIQTSTAVKSSAGAVYWVSVSDTAALAISIRDAASDTGDTKWGIDLPAGGYGHFIFDPPIECATGIYVKVSTATCKVSVGYI